MFQQIVNEASHGGGQHNQNNNFGGGCFIADPPNPPIPQSQDNKAKSLGGVNYSSSNIMASKSAFGAPIKLSLNINFSEATAPATVLLFDGNFMFEYYILASLFTGAVPNKTAAGYALIGAVINGTWGDRMLELLTIRYSNNPIILTNINAVALTGGSPGTQATIPDDTYFATNDLLYQYADDIGNGQPQTIPYPDVQPTQFKGNVRQFCGFQYVIDGNAALLVPMQTGNKLTMTFHIPASVRSYQFTPARQG